MKNYPLYQNPYDVLRIEADTVLNLHAVPLGENELSLHVVNLSPFATKLEAYFRLFDIKHALISEASSDVGPRGKVPFISVGDTQIADSGLIIDHLKHALGDPDSHLSAEQKALGQVVQATLEDSVCWIILYYHFFDQSGWDFLMKTVLGDTSALPTEVQEELRLRREDFRRRCYDQGIARFTPVEVADKAKRDLAAINVLLGKKPFLLGSDRPSSYDAVIFGFTQAFLQARGLHPEVTDFARTLPNLGRFISTFTATWYPELKLAFQPA